LEIASKIKITIIGPLHLKGTLLPTACIREIVRHFKTESVANGTCEMSIVRKKLYVGYRRGSTGVDPVKHRNRPIAQLANHRPGTSNIPCLNKIL
jgi:hypothetical protein